MEQTKQNRKAYPKGHQRGVKTQKLVSFKLDLKFLKWFESKPNKGRYLNNLIDRDIKAALVDYYDHEDMYGQNYTPPC